MKNVARPHISWITSIFYGIGAVPGAVKNFALTAFLMIYYNQVIGLSAVLVSTVLMISLVCDAIFDPLIGQFSDHFRSRWGRRIPFMYMSAIPTTVLFILLWSPPTGWSQMALAIYLGACVIGVRLFDSFFELPYQAIVPELAADYNDRTTLFTFSSIFATASGLGVSLLAYNVFLKETPRGTGGVLSAHGYFSYGLFSALTIGLTILICTAGLHRHMPRFAMPPVRKINFATMVKEIVATLNSQSFIVLAVTGMFMSIGAGIGGALNLYWGLYFYQFSQAELSLLAIPSLIGGLTGAFSTTYISGRLGKRRAAIILAWIFVFASSAPILARALDLVPTHSTGLLALVVVQAALGVPAYFMVVIILSSMTADLVEDAEIRTGRRSEGLLFSVNNLVKKATSGLGTLGAGFILTAVGFPVGAERHEVAPQVLSHMAELYLFANFVLFLLATICLSFYRVDRASHEANLRKLATTTAVPE